MTDKCVITTAAQSLLHEWF